MDYALELICDHTWNGAPTSADERVVSTVAFFPKPPGAIGWLEWRAVVGAEGREYPSAAQTYYGEARRLGRSGTDRPSNELVPGMTEGQRWRFWCSDCGATLPTKHSKVVPIFDGLRRAGRKRLTIGACAGLTVEVDLRRSSN